MKKPIFRHSATFVASISLFIIIVILLVLKFSTSGNINPKSSSISSTTKPIVNSTATLPIFSNTENLLTETPITTARVDFTLNDFMSMFPHAIIVASASADIDGDGTVDNIIIYDNPDTKGTMTNSNIFIRTAASSASVDLAGGDTDFSFAYNEKSLTIDQANHTANVFLNDAKLGKVITFSIKVSSDIVNRSVNLKVSTD